MGKAHGAHRLVRDGGDALGEVGGLALGGGDREASAIDDPAFVGIARRRFGRGDGGGHAARELGQHVLDGLKVEIGRPNCTRCLEYSTAVASTLSAAPAICMARMTAASSKALGAHRRGAAEFGRGIVERHRAVGLAGMAGLASILALPLATTARVPPTMATKRSAAEAKGTRSTLPLRRLPAS